MGLVPTYKDLKANLLLKHNIDALLAARKQSRRDLARWVLRTTDKRADSWVSHIFRKDAYETREIPLKYLDRIADFFGIATYQLFQPGISPLTERRRGVDRRSGRDRRISAAVLSQKRGDTDLIDIIRALNDEGRADVLVVARDKLSEQIDALRPPRYAAGRRADADHTAGSAGEAVAAGQGRKKKRTEQ